MKRKTILFLAPLWEYLNQPLFENQSVWDFHFFRYLYRVQLLHKCWEKEFLTKGSTHSQ